MTASNVEPVVRISGHGLYLEKTFLMLQEFQNQWSGRIIP